MATAPRHALPASATFPAPGVAASIQRAVAAARQTGDRPADPAPVDTLLEIHAGTTYRIALGIARDAGRAEAALHVVFPHFLGGPGRRGGPRPMAATCGHAGSAAPGGARLFAPALGGAPPTRSRLTGSARGARSLRPRVRPPSGPSQRSAVAAGELGRAGRAAVAEQAIDGLSGRERATLVPVDG